MGVYRAMYIQREPKRCHINFSSRLPLLSQSSDINECVHEYETILSSKKIDVPKPCICGMPITNVFLIKNIHNDKIIQLGSECINRINPQIIKNFNKSNIKHGNCDVCSVKGHQLHCDNLAKHLKTKAHMKKLEAFKMTRATKIEQNITYKLNNRMCVTCCKGISKKEPEWKIRCLKCYVKHVL